MLFTTKFITKFYMWVGIFLAAASLTLNPSQASSPNLKTILVLGDSLSAAYNLPQEEGWVALLEQKLQTENPNWQVVNASISGETTAGGLSRLPRLLSAHQPQIILLALGSNDGLRGLPPALVKRNLAAMLDLAQQKNSQVILIGSLLPRNYGAKYLHQFEKIFPDLAATKSLSWVEFLLAGVADEPKLMQQDGLHPTAEAQPKILRNVWVVLESNLN